MTDRERLGNWPAFADLPKEGPGTGLGSSPRLSELGTAVVLSPDDYERCRLTYAASLPPELEEIRERRQKITGPWRVAYDADSGCYYIPRVGVHAGYPMLTPEDDDSPIDRVALEFAAHARDDIDRLLAYAAARDARIAELRKALEGCDELFGNYGFADESPCRRDRQIVADLHAALGRTPPPGGST